MPTAAGVPARRAVGHAVAALVATRQRLQCVECRTDVAPADAELCQQPLGLCPPRVDENLGLGGGVSGVLGEASQLGRSLAQSPLHVLELSNRTGPFGERRVGHRLGLGDRVTVPVVDDGPGLELLVQPPQLPRLGVDLTLL